jgi:hypothetical protein
MAPREAASFAVARPIPLAPPVIATTLPPKDGSCIVVKSPVGQLYMGNKSRKQAKETKDGQSAPTVYLIV